MRLFAPIRNQRGGGVALGTGAETVACRGRPLPTKLGPGILNVGGEEGECARCPRLSRTQLHALHLCCSKQPPVDSVSGRGMKAQASSLWLFTTDSQISIFDGTETLRAPTHSHPGLRCIPATSDLEDFLVKRGKPWTHPQRAGAGL